MDYVVLSLLMLALTGGAWVCWQIYLEKLRDLAVSKVSSEQFSAISAELGQVGTVVSKGYFLRAVRGGPISSTFHVALPPNMDVDWLERANVAVSLIAEPQSEDNCGEASVIVTSGFVSDFELVPIPRIGFKNAGAANQYTPKVWFKRSENLLRLATEIYPRDPEGFLFSLLNGTGRVNAPFDWLQSPPRLRCKSCSAKLLPVLQVCGGSVGLDAESVYYVAACPAEKGRFQIFAQMS